ncbi:MAG: TonB-dependent receptor [Thermohalobaculum sp.]
MNTMTRRPRVHRLCWLVGTALCHAGTAMAQPPARPDAAAAQVENVVVTAQKRKQRLLDLGAPVSVLSERELAAKHVTGLQDLTGAVPGLVVTGAGQPGRTSIVLRGLSANGNGVLTAAMIDDTVVGASNANTAQDTTALDLPPYDLDRIEVLKGPQGTIYGANSAGGLVRYISKEPDLDKLGGALGGDLTGVSNAADVGQNFRAALNIPLLRDRLGLRVSGYRISEPGFTDNVRTGKRGDNGATRTGGRGVLLWRPNDAVSFKLAGQYALISSDNFSRVRIARLGAAPPYREGGFLDGDLGTDPRFDQPFRSETSLITGTLKWDLGFADLTGTAAYSRVNTSTVLDTTYNYSALLNFFNAIYVPFGIGNVTYPSGSPAAQTTALRTSTDTKRYTPELRLASKPGGRLQWLLGIYYDYEKTFFIEDNFYADGAGRKIGLYDGQFVRGSYPSPYREYAGFANATYRLTERLDFTAGIRGSQISNSVKNIRLIGDSVTIATGGGYVSSITGAGARETVVSFAAGPLYHLTPNSSVYFRAASGYRPPVPNLQIPQYPFIPLQTQSDRAVSYDLGYRGRLPWGLGQLDASLFRIDWSRVQTLTSTTDGVQVYSINGGDAVSQGAEAALTIRPGTDLTVVLGAAYTDAQFAENFSDPSSGFAVRKGAALAGVSKWTGSLAASYLLPEWRGFLPTLSASARYFGPKLSLPSDDPNTARTDAYALVDASLTAERGPITVSLYVRNLFDERKVFTASQTGDQLSGDRWLRGALVQPRTIGLGVDYRF